MEGMRLVIYDRNYSSWSMRAGLALRLTGAAFTEVAYQTAAPDEQAELKRRSPTGLYPLLEHGDVCVWDSLAIIEYLAELFPDAGLWPKEREARAHARSVSAEMHSGFLAVRQQMPMNIRARYASFPRQPELGAHFARLKELWAECRERFGQGGDFLFGGFGAADCMFAPIVMRMRTYDVGLDAGSEAYARAVEAHPVVRDWIEGAQAEGYRNEKYDLVTG
jgi:glutathione S-transferase